MTQELKDLCEKTQTSVEGMEKLVNYYIQSLGWTEEQANDYAIKLFNNGTIETIKFLGKEC